jgi:hypothetical protein
MAQHTCHTTCCNMSAPVGSLFVCVSISRGVSLVQVQVSESESDDARLPSVLLLRKGGLKGLTYSC